MKISELKQKTTNFTKNIISNSKKIYSEPRNKSDFEKTTTLFLKKIYYVLQKNYLTAIRNPKLYISLIIAPLLFVLIIGLAFNTSHLRTDLKIGIYDESTNQLILNVFDEVDRVSAINLSSEEICKQSLIDKENVVCITVLEKNNYYDVNIYFDYSRMSLYSTAYTTVRETLIEFDHEITRTLLEELKEKTNPSKFEFEEIKKELNTTEIQLLDATTKLNELLTKLSSNTSVYEYKINEVINEMNDLKNQIISHQSSINKYEEDIKNTKKETETAHTNILKAKTSMDASLTICGNEGTNLNSQLYEENIAELITQEDNPGCTALKTIASEIENYEQFYYEINQKLNQAENDIVLIKNSINNLKITVDKYTNNLEEEKQQMSQSEQFYLEELTTFEEDLKKHSKEIIKYSDMIQNLNIEMEDFHTSLNPEKIIDKYKKNILLITETRNMLSYSLHLIIPFILLLSSLLISISLNRKEYKTSAFQRNKMLKTNMFLFAGNTLFVLIIMLLELIFILILFNVFFKANTIYNMPYILFASTIFIIIWSIIGFIISRNINSDEGAIFSGTILGLIVFFLSDVMVPMESFPNIILYLYKINPFVHFSNIIRSNYLIQEPISIISSTVLFLIVTLLILLITGIILVRRDMNDAS